MKLIPDTMDDWNKKHTAGWLAAGASLGLVYNAIRKIRHRRTAAHKLFPGICCR